MWKFSMSRRTNFLLSSTMLAESGAPQHILGRPILARDPERDARNEQAIASFTTWQRIRWEKAGAIPDLAPHFARATPDNWRR